MSYFTKTVENIGENTITIVFKDGKPLWLPREIGNILYNKYPTSFVTKLLAKWKDTLKEGKDYERLEGAELVSFKDAFGINEMKFVSHLTLFYGSAVKLACSQINSYNSKLLSQTVRECETISNASVKNETDDVCCCMLDDVDKVVTDVRECLDDVCEKTFKKAKDVNYFNKLKESIDKVETMVIDKVETMVREYNPKNKLTKAKLKLNRMEIELQDDEIRLEIRL